MPNFNPQLPTYDHIHLSEEESAKAIVRFKEQRRREQKLPPFVQVPLTEDEVKEALRRGRSLKAARLIEAEYFRKISQAKCYPTYSAKKYATVIIDKANDMIKRTKGANKEFLLHAHNRSIIWKLCQYFTADPAFETDGHSLSKGLMILGPVGCGKSFLMELFRNNQVASFKPVKCRNISYEFAKEGFDVIKNYTRLTNSTENQFGHSVYGTCFDDIGSEDERKFYGDKVNAMAEIIAGRYDLNQHPMTHITTNLDGDQLEEVYGLRLRSRMREMFNMIAFSPASPDMRR